MKAGQDATARLDAFPMPGHYRPARKQLCLHCTLGHGANAMNGKRDGIDFADPWAAIEACKERRTALLFGTRSAARAGAPSTAPFD